MIHPRPALSRPVLAFLCALIVGLVCVADAAAQSPAIEKLRRRFDTERQELVRSRGADYSFEDLKTLVGRQCEELDDFIARTAGTPDAINGRLLQVDMLAATGQRDAALKALGRLDADAADALQLLAAAEIASLLRDREARSRFLERGFAKARDRSVPLERRMAAAMFLMTRLVEVAKGETLLEEALDAASNDEERARIGWFRCAAYREREDLPEGAYGQSLGKLAAELPNTRYGRLAADRLTALEFDIGDDALPLVRIGAGGKAEAVKSLDGRTIDLTALRGKVVVLDFFAAWDLRNHARLDVLAKLQAALRERGLTIVGVALDRDRAALDKVLDERSVDWTVVQAPAELESDLAVRYMVEQVPRTFVIDREGKIASIGGLDHAGDEDLFREELERILGTGGGAHEHR